MKSSNFKLYVAMVAAMFIWGISWPNAKITGQYASPDLLMFWRFTLACATMIPIMFFMGKKFTFPQTTLKYVIIAAVCLTAYNYGYFKGTQIGMASLGGIIVPTLSPLVTYLLVVLIFDQSIRRKEILGFMIGILGGLVLLRIWEVDLQDLFDSGNIYFIFAAIIWTGVTIMTQKSREETDVINFSFWLYLFSAILAFSFAPKGQLFTIFTFDWIFWVNFLMISVVSLAIGTTVFFQTTMRLGSEKASAFMYVVPVTAMVFSVILLGETLPWSTIVGGSMAIGAVYIVNRQ